MYYVHTLSSALNALRLLSSIYLINMLMTAAGR